MATYSLEEIGLYSVLLAFDWSLTGLPLDHESLARLSRVSVRKFVKLWPKVADQFIEREGRMYNPRLEIERKRQADWREKSAKGGRKGGTRVVEPPIQANDNTQSLTQSQSLTLEQSSSSDVARLIDGLPDTTAVRMSWAAEIDAARQGMHGPILTDEQVDRACRDYVGNDNLKSPSLRHFRAFLVGAARVSSGMPFEHESPFRTPELLRWGAEQDAKDAETRARNSR